MPSSNRIEKWRVDTLFSFATSRPQAATKFGRELGIACPRTHFQELFVQALEAGVATIAESVGSILPDTIQKVGERLGGCEGAPPTFDEKAHKLKRPEFLIQWPVLGDREVACYARTRFRPQLFPLLACDLSPSHYWGFCVN